MYESMNGSRHTKCEALEHTFAADEKGEKAYNNKEAAWKVCLDQMESQKPS